MTALKKSLLPKLALAFALIGFSCGADRQQTQRLPGETILGSTKAAHSLTRGHNRKVVYDSNSGHWYIFWLREDGRPDFDRSKEGVVYQVSGDGLKWSEPVLIEPSKQGGITALDVVLAGTRLYVLGLTPYPDTSGASKRYAVREIEIKGDGSLVSGAPQIVFDSSSSNESLHFYGSLLHDSEGYFWVAARVGDSTPGTHADVIRSTEPGSIAAWGAKGCIGQSCNSEWTNPYAKSGRNLLRGTIASRLLDLGPHGVGLVTYNKNDGGANQDPRGQILFVRNPSRAHDGWESSSILLTDRANQYIRSGSARGADKTRLDDRRFAALIDPRTHIIHVAYVAADTNTRENANLRYFTLAPPYRLEDKSAETVLINKEVDGVHLSIDTRTTPSVLYIFYVANEQPDYQIRMIKNRGSEWSTPVNISNGVGVVRYPQPPETIPKDKIVIGYQYSEKVPEGLNYLICVRQVDLTAIK